MFAIKGKFNEKAVPEEGMMPNCLKLITDSRMIKFKSIRTPSKCFHRI